MKRVKFLVCFMFLVICINFNVSASAKTVTNPSTVTLSIGTKYTAYDVTGDRIADSFQLTYVSGGIADGDSCYKGVNVYVNGKKSAYVEGWIGYYTLTAKLYTLSNGKVFLYMYGTTFNQYCAFAGLYQYNSGTFERVANLYSYLKKYGCSYGGTVTQVNGKSLTVQFVLDSYSTGYTSINYTYTWKSGKLKRSTYGTYAGVIQLVNGYSYKTTQLMINKKLVAYKSPGSSKKAFTLKKGYYVYLDKCRVVNGNMYIRVCYGTEYGWIKALKKYPTTGQFASVEHVN